MSGELLYAGRKIDAIHRRSLPPDALARTEDIVERDVRRYLEERGVRDVIITYEVDLDGNLLIVGSGWTVVE